MNEKIKAIIIGGLHHNTLGVKRSLGEAGIKKDNIHVLIVEKNAIKKNFVAASKYIAKGNILYIKNSQEIIPWLITASKIYNGAVITCCSDEASEVVINHYNELNKWYKLPSIKRDIIEYMSKENQSELAVRCGLNIPKSQVIKSNEYDEWNIFPCITKPFKSATGAGKADIKISRDKSELDIAMHSTESEYVQIQEYISKELEYQLIGCSLEGGELIIIPGYTRLIRQPLNTNTGYLEYSPISGFSYDVEAVKSFIKSLGYSGLFSMEFLRDKDNIDYFLEINMRNDGNAYCVKTAGVNLPYIWNYYQTFKKMPVCPVTFTKPVRFMPDLSDARRGIQTVGLLRWIKEFFCAESHSVYNTKDLKPIIVQISEKFSRIIKK